MKFILAGMYSYALRSIVFGAPRRFWTLWLFELLNVCLDSLVLILFSKWVSLLERAAETLSA